MLSKVSHRLSSPLLSISIPLPSFLSFLVPAGNETSSRQHRGWSQRVANGSRCRMVPCNHSASLRPVILCAPQPFFFSTSFFSFFCYASRVKDEFFRLWRCPGWSRHVAAVGSKFVHSAEGRISSWNALIDSMFLKHKRADY